MARPRLPWRDCEKCGWRNYVRAETNGNGAASVTWLPPERCDGCGARLGVELDRLDAKASG